MRAAKKRPTQADRRALRAALLRAYEMAGQAARGTSSADRSPHQWAHYVVGVLMALGEVSPEDVLKAFGPE